MATKWRVPPMQGPSRVPAFTTGSLDRSVRRILARLLSERASPAMSGTTLERSRMRPLSSMMPGFSRPGAPKRTSFMKFPPHCLEIGRTNGSDYASPSRGGQAKIGPPACRSMPGIELDLAALHPSLGRGRFRDGPSQVRNGPLLERFECAFQLSDGVARSGLLPGSCRPRPVESFLDLACFPGDILEFFEPDYSR